MLSTKRRIGQTCPDADWQTTLTRHPRLGAPCATNRRSATPPRQVSPVSDAKFTARDMSAQWRLVYVSGPVYGTFRVSAEFKGRISVRAVDVTIWYADAEYGRVVRELCAWVKDGQVDIPKHMIDPMVRDDVLDRLDDMKAAVLAAA